MSEMEEEAKVAAALREECDRLQTELASAALALAERDERDEQLRCERGRLQDRIEQLEKERGEAEVRLEKAERQNERLLVELEERRDLEEKIKQFEQFLDAAEQMKANYEARIARLRKAIVEMRRGSADSTGTAPEELAVIDMETGDVVRERTDAAGRDVESGVDKPVRKSASAEGSHDRQPTDNDWLQELSL